MIQQNNFCTIIKKWGTIVQDRESPPRFFKQHFSLKDKFFIPYDELKTYCKVYKSENVIPHFFIDDSKQTCFASHPDAHSDLLDTVHALCSPDYSVYTNVFAEFNISQILLSRLIARYWQDKGRFVILSVSWSQANTFDIAFNNVEKGCIVAVSHIGVTDETCFKQGFIEMLKRIEPETICWYGAIPFWVDTFYETKNIIRMQKRFSFIQEKKLQRKCFLNSVYQ